jgi:hypothetical protein
MYQPGSVLVETLSDCSELPKNLSYSSFRRRPESSGFAIGYRESLQALWYREN